MQYPPQTLKRALRAVRCSPFQLKLFTDLQQHRVSLAEITGSEGVTRGYTQRPLPELIVENSLMWLMQVGLLRREVDGQGLTDSFRLTPLGRELSHHWQTGAWGNPSWWERLQDFVSYGWHRGL